MQISPGRKIAKARASLLLSHPFFGFILMKLIPVESKALPTMATDGVTMYYNPDFVSSLSMKKLRAGLAHECLHPAFKHNFRRGGRDLKEWNISCDLAINPILAEAGFTLGESWLLEKRFYNMSAEKIHRIRLRERNEQKEGDPKGQGSPQPGKGSPQGASQGLPQDNLPTEKTKDSTGKAKSAVSKTAQDVDSESAGDRANYHNDHNHEHGCGGILDFPGKDDKPATSAEKDKASAEWQITISQAAAFAEAQGKLPGQLKRFVDQFRVPSVTPWDILRRFIEQAAKNDHNWLRPSKRYVSSGFYLPSIRSNELGEIVVAIDTSCSIKQPVLDRFGGHLVAMLHAVKVEKVHVVYCDAAVKGTEEFSSDDIPLQLKSKGGGGTSFIPPFEWVEGQSIQPACLIYLTDGECNRFPEDPGYPVLWAIDKPDTWVDRKHVPFGEKIAIGE